MRWATKKISTSTWDNDDDNKSQRLSHLDLSPMTNLRLFETALISLSDLTRLQSLPPIWNVPSSVQLVESGVWQTQPKKQVPILTLRTVSTLCYGEWWRTGEENTVCTTAVHQRTLKNSWHDTPFSMNHLFYDIQNHLDNQVNRSSRSNQGQLGRYYYFISLVQTKVRAPFPWSKNLNIFSS